MNGFTCEKEVSKETQWANKNGRVVLNELMGMEKCFDVWKAKNA